MNRDMYTGKIKFLKRIPKKELKLLGLHLGPNLQQTNISKNEEYIVSQLNSYYYLEWTIFPKYQTYTISRRDMRALYNNNYIKPI